MMASHGLKVNPSIDEILPKLKNVRKSGSGGFLASCPAHKDDHPSLSGGTGADGRILLKCHAGCTFQDIMRAIGLGRSNGSLNNGKLPSKPTAIYPYRDEAGKPLYEVVRYDTPQGKKIRQRRPDGNGGYRWDLRGVRRVPYRLPELLATPEWETVFILEGEKCVEAVVKLGLAATTNSGGAGKWPKDFAKYFEGRDVVIIPDHDAPGIAHAAAVAENLLPVAARARVLNLPGLGDKEDIVEWIGRGGTKAKLLELVDQAPEATAWLAEREKTSEKANIETAGIKSLGDGQAESGNNKPSIEITVSIKSVVDQVENVLLKNGGGLYQRGRNLVRIARSGTDSKKRSWMQRPTGTPYFCLAEHDFLRELFAESAIWYKVNKKGDAVPELPPPWAVDTLLARGEWKFPYVVGVVETPIVRNDGSVLDTPGYDEDTGLIFDPGNCNFPKLSNTISREEAKEAYDFICDEAFGDFKFVDACDKAAAVAALCTVMMRQLGIRSPMFLIRAPSAGSGKTLLADTVATIATGRVATRMVQAPTSEEESKRLLSVALEGYPLVLIDNVERVLSSDALSAALTGDVLRDRVLGKTQMVEVPLMQTWMASGNNLIVRGDLSRRCIPIDLDVGEEFPEERRGFQHDPLLEYACAERGKLAVAALKIVKAFLDAGQPKQDLVPFGSFEDWHKVIRSAVFWVSAIDPCEGRQRIRKEGDPERENLDALLSAWYDVFQSVEVKLATVIEKAREGGGLLNADLFTALSNFRGKSKTDFDANSLGYALRRYRDRIVNKKVFRGINKERKGLMLWRVEIIPGSNAISNDNDLCQSAGDAGDESTLTREENMGSSNVTVGDTEISNTAEQEISPASPADSHKPLSNNSDKVPGMNSTRQAPLDENWEKRGYTFDPDFEEV